MTMTPTIDQNRLAQFTSGARTLAVGGHSSPHDDLCLLEATAFVAGVPHSDHPACVSPSIAALGRSLNDGPFRDHLSELIPYIPRLVGTVASKEVEERRMWLLTDWATREMAPLAMEAAELHEQAATLRALAPVTDEETAHAARIAAARAAEAEKQAEIRASCLRLLDRLIEMGVAA